MKKVLLTLSMALAISVGAQNFSTGTVSLPTASMTVQFVTNPTTITMTLTGDQQFHACHWFRIKRNGEWI